MKQLIERDSQVFSWVFDLIQMPAVPVSKNGASASLSVPLKQAGFLESLLADQSFSHGCYLTFLHQIGVEIQFFFCFIPVDGHL